MPELEAKKYIEQWQAARQTIEQAYQKRSKEAPLMLDKQVHLLIELIQSFGLEQYERTETPQYILAPLNYEERLSFIQAKRTSHYAFIQLDALFEETAKKLARIAARKKRTK